MAAKQTSPWEKQWLVSACGTGTRPGGAPLGGERLLGERPCQATEEEVGRPSFSEQGRNSKKEILGDTIEEKLDSYVIKAKESGCDGRGWEQPIISHTEKFLCLERNFRE